MLTLSNGELVNILVQVVVLTLAFGRLSTQVEVIKTKVGYIERRLKMGDAIDAE
jgi:hypothetical protein